MSTVLVVDDRAINREFLGTLLGYAGFEVIDAADGAEALEMVGEHRPDLVITDIVMPTMDGMELVRRLRDDPGTARIPVVFYTATYRVNEARGLAEACGAVAVLSKPSEPEAILAAVAKALGVTLRPTPPPPAVPGALGVLPPHLREVVELEHRLQRALEEGHELIGGREAPPPASERLLRAYATVQSLSLRLAALLELGVMLPAERQPQQLLELVCRAACDILDARLAVALAGVEGPRPRRFAAHGMTAEQTAAVFESIDPRAGVLGRVLADSVPRRLRGLDGDPAAVGLPAGHPRCAICSRCR